MNSHYRPTDKLEQGAREHNALREELIAIFGLEPGDQALIDTLEGATTFDALVIAALREAKVAEANAEAMKAIIEANQARKKRHEATAKNIRLAIMDAMQRAGEKKITSPDMTISISTRSASLEIADPDAVPHSYCQQVITWKPDREKIQDALNNGEKLNFAVMGEPKTTLSLRTK